MNADNNDWLNWQSVIGSRKVWRFSPNAANSDFTATNIHVTSHGTEFTLQTPTGSVDVLLPLPGRHNIANALAAAALSMSVGATLDAIKAGLANLKAVRAVCSPSNWRKTSCCSTTPTTPMSVQ